MRTTTHRTHRQKGAVFVETALVMLTFIIVMVGIADFATFLHLHQAITERTRNVARIAAIEDLSETKIQNMIAYGVETVEEDETLPGYFGLKPSNIAVSVQDRGLSSQRIIVTVSGLSFPLVSPLLSGSGRNMPIRMSLPLEAP
jgi:hypothetical protein